MGAVSEAGGDGGLEVDRFGSELWAVGGIARTDVHLGGLGETEQTNVLGRSGDIRIVARHSDAETLPRPSQIHGSGKTADQADGCAGHSSGKSL